MIVKARKVGNSFTLTIPSSIVSEMKVHDGLELEVDYNQYSGVLSYHPNRIIKIDWDEFTSKDKDKEDIRDGMKPEDYVRSLRDNDREENIF